MALKRGLKEKRVREERGKKKRGKRLRESGDFIPHFPSRLGKQSGHAVEPSIMVIACEENV